jgi:hypothetical protein
MLRRKKRPSRREECSLGIPNEQGATPRGAFTGATPTSKLYSTGLGPIFRPTAFKFAGKEQLYSAHFAIFAKKMAASSDFSNSVNRPSQTEIGI